MGFQTIPKKCGVCVGGRLNRLNQAPMSRHIPPELEELQAELFCVPSLELAMQPISTRIYLRGGGLCAPCALGGRPGEAPARPFGARRRLTQRWRYQWRRRWQLRGPTDPWRWRMWWPRGESARRGFRAMAGAVTTKVPWQVSR